MVIAGELNPVAGTNGPDEKGGDLLLCNKDYPGFLPSSGRSGCLLSASDHYHLDSFSPQLHQAARACLNEESFAITLVLVFNGGLHPRVVKLDLRYPVETRTGPFNRTRTCC